MTEFLGTKMGKDGRRKYNYACRCCGKTVSYKTKHKADFPAICVPCQKKNAAEQKINKRKAEDDAIWDEAVNAFEEAILMEINKSGIIFKGQFREYVKMTAAQMRKGTKEE